MFLRLFATGFNPILVPVPTSVVLQFTTGEYDVESGPKHVGDHVPVPMLIPLAARIENEGRFQPQLPCGEAGSQLLLRTTANPKLFQLPQEWSKLL